MSTDDEQATEAGAPRMSRLRSVVAEGARRYQALLKSMSTADSGRNDLPSPDQGDQPGQRDRQSGEGQNGEGRGPGLGTATDRATDDHVPAPLRKAADWAWRMLLVAAVVYLAFKVAVALRLLVLPFIAAILLCALLQPLASLLRDRLNMPNLLATGLTLLAAIGVLTGVGILITNQVQAGYPNLSHEVLHTVHQAQKFLAKPPFRLNAARFNQLSKHLVSYLAQHKTVVAGTVLTGGKYFAEVLTGLILTVFITFFLLKDGPDRWDILVDGYERFRHGGEREALKRAKARSDRASGAAWAALVKYIQGTTIIALIHAVLIGIALWLLGVPLVMPLAILVFLAAYVPLIGILIVGAIAILVTLATQGGVAAIILLVVFLAENQLESHLLQPLVIGRAVRLHPLEVIVVLAVGGIVAGIPGAIIAVPTAAVISAAWRSNHPLPLRPPRPPRRKRRSRLASDRSGSAETGELAQ